MMPDLKFRIVAQGETARAFAGVRSEVTKTQSAFAGLKSQITGFRSALGLGGATIGIGALMGVGEAISEIADKADDLVDTADKIGITTTALQELQYQAELNGASAEEMSAGLAYFSRQISIAAQKGGDLADVLKANGVALRDASGKQRPFNDLVGDYADLIAGAKNEQDRARLVTIAFGRANDALGVSFATGAAGIRANAEEVHRLGGVLDDVRLREMAALKDEWTRTTTQMTTEWQKFVIFLATTGNTLGRNGVFDVLQFPVNPGAAGLAIGALIGRSLNPPTAEDLAKAEISARFQMGFTGQNGFSLEDFKRDTVLPSDPLKETTGAIDDTTYALVDLKDEFAATRDMAKGFAGDFIQGIKGGESAVDALGNALDNIANRLIGLGLDAIFGAVFPMPGSITLPTPHLRPFGGPRAAGGPVSPAHSYLVGERGPELFTPRSAGMISAGGGGANVNLTVNVAVHGNADARAIASIGDHVRRVVRDEMPNALRRAQANRELF